MRLGGESAEDLVIGIAARHQSDLELLLVAEDVVAGVAGRVLQAPDGLGLPRVHERAQLAGPPLRAEQEDVLVLAEAHKVLLAQAGDEGGAAAGRAHLEREVLVGVVDVGAKDCVRHR